MNLRTLEIFQVVCEEGNITKAAAKLYMSQPAVSHAIRDLEQELQLQLFDRFGKRIHLNTTGSNFLMRAQRVLKSYDELVHAIPLLEEESTIRIGSSITIANDHLPRVLREFKKAYPHVKTEVFVESAGNVLERLRKHTIDIALVEGVVIGEQWEQEVFSAYELQVVCSKSHLLATKQLIKWEEIRQADWLLREKGSAARDSFDSVCRIHQIIINPTWTSVNSQALLQAVRQNLGLSILPDSIIDRCSFKNELHYLVIQGETLCNENHIVYDKGIFLSKPLQALIKQLKK